MAVQDLDGAVVAITGGGRGIGLETARALAARGARVAIGDIDTALAERAAAGLGGRKGHHHGGHLDVRDRASFATFLAAAQRELGPLDVLVNNAGIMPMGPFIDEDDAISEAQIDINLRGVIHGTKLALPGMLQRGSGHIVNVASLAGRFAIPGAAVYCATKYAVVGFTETLREEYRGSGVDFSTVMPSRVSTELVAGTTAGSGLPTVSPEEVAAAIVAALDELTPEVIVPRYLAPMPALYGLAPRWLLRGVRELIQDRRILDDLDLKARAGYDQRLAALARGAAPKAAARVTAKTPRPRQPVARAEKKP